MSGLPVALTIAGSDSGAGAGLQADLRVFALLGVYGYSAATLVSAQNADGIQRIEPVAPEMVAAQIEAVAAEHRPAAVKTGALLSARTVKVVADAIKTIGLPAPVVDPILVASSGTSLLDENGEAALRDELIPLAVVVTPNIPEAERLSGIVIDGPEAMRAAAEAIYRIGPRAVVIKGGHGFSGDRQGLRNQASRGAIDIFHDGKEFIALEYKRIESASLHGSGCIFSAAIAGYLARGGRLIDAVTDAKKFVGRAIRNRVQLGRGRQVFFR